MSRILVVFLFLHGNRAAELARLLAAQQAVADSERCGNFGPPPQSGELACVS
jgi:hypothetical protein